MVVVDRLVFYIFIHHKGRKNKTNKKQKNLT